MSLNEQTEQLLLLPAPDFFFSFFVLLCTTTTTHSQALSLLLVHGVGLFPQGQSVSSVSGAVLSPWGLPMGRFSGSVQKVTKNEEFPFSEQKTQPEAAGHTTLGGDSKKSRN